MSQNTVTRGTGLLEGMLSKLRSRMANKLIPPETRSGSVLDIGCGLSPYFLSTTKFKTKFGVDKLLKDTESFDGQDFTIRNFDIEKGERLPFADNSFDVVTMLAVFEHIKLSFLSQLICEIYRVLKPGGHYIITTPSSRSDLILKVMAKINLVSSEEINEHQDLWSHKKIIKILEDNNFNNQKIKKGYFELGLNLWVKATK
ncbi:MAG: class I SAM-dependent methyltransferase [Parcubacteria group bacterium]|nr:class I SAM-dependent methyltransferase [Parcubacteria group bacterium]